MNMSVVLSYLFLHVELFQCWRAASVQHSHTANTPDKNSWPGFNNQNSFNVEKDVNHYWANSCDNELFDVRDEVQMDSSSLDYHKTTSFWFLWMSWTQTFFFISLTCLSLSGASAAALCYVSVNYRLCCGMSSQLCISVTWSLIKSVW